MIGIIVADPNEINKFPFDVKETKKINQFEFTVFDGIVAVHSGIGIANSAAATQELISSFEVTSIINYGAVGGNKNVDVYDLIAPQKIFYHDVITPWYKRGQTPGEAEYYLNKYKANKTNNLASGSAFLSSNEEIETISNEMGVDIFDMEGAAIAQIATKNKIDLYMIKCVSDSVGETDTNLEDINTRINNAGKIAFDATISLVEEIR